jgi:hypothetical protein
LADTSRGRVSRSRSDRRHYRGARDDDDDDDARRRSLPPRLLDRAAVDTSREVATVSGRGSVSVGARPRTSGVASPRSRQTRAIFVRSDKRRGLDASTRAPARGLPRGKRRRRDRREVQGMAGVPAALERGGGPRGEPVSLRRVGVEQGPGASPGPKLGCRTFFSILFSRRRRNSRTARA